MTMTGKDRAALRAEAHHVRPTVHVGQHGLTDTLLASLDDALRTRELVKIKFERGAPVQVREGANRMATDMQAEVIQVIGRTTTLYRFNPDLKRSVDMPPPWKR